MKSLLLPVSWLYGLAVWVRNVCYDAGVLPIATMDVPVVSVGNLSAGGTGKTPIVEYIMNYFLSQNRTVAVVSRGYKRTTRGTFVVSDGTHSYGSAAEAGDEPLQLARNAPRAVVVVDERRARGARAAIERFRPDVVILDVAFQHRAIARDLDILVLDATVPLAKMPLLPAGLRREPFGAMKRAGAIGFSRALPQADLRAIVASITSAPTFSVRFAPTGLGQLGAPGISPVASLRGKRSLAFCGIGNPEAFRGTLEQAGAVVLELLKFHDHHRYDAADLGRIVAAARQTGAELIVTTEKDSVRLIGEDLTAIPPDLTLAFVTIGVEFLEGKDAFHRLPDATVRRVA